MANRLDYKHIRSIADNTIARPWATVGGAVETFLNNAQKVAWLSQFCASVVCTPDIGELVAAKIEARGFLVSRCECGNVVVVIGTWALSKPLRGASDA